MIELVRFGGFGTALDLAFDGLADHVQSRLASSQHSVNAFGRSLGKREPQLFRPFLLAPHAGDIGRLKHFRQSVLFFVYTVLYITGTRYIFKSSQHGDVKMTTFTIECAGFTGQGLPTIAAVQAWIDSLKAGRNVKGEQVRVYRFINGVRKGGIPDLVGVVS